MIVIINPPGLTQHLYNFPKKHNNIHQGLTPKEKEILERNAFESEEDKNYRLKCEISGIDRDWYHQHKNTSVFELISDVFSSSYFLE